MRKSVILIDGHRRRVHYEYKSIGHIYCTVLSEYVVFNNHGWKHITFEGKGHRRSTKNILMRLDLVLYAPQVIQHASLIIKDDIRKQDINGTILNIRFIELANHVSIINRNITVIIRKIENGSFHYYSVRRTKNKIKKLLLNQKSS